MYDLVIRDGTAYNNFGVALYLPPGTIQEVSMYDARQETYVKVTEIDMAMLNVAKRIGPAAPSSAATWLDVVRMPVINRARKWSFCIQTIRFQSGYDN